MRVKFISDPREERMRDVQASKEAGASERLASAMGTPSDVAQDNIPKGSPIMGTTAMYVATANIARGERLVENINVRKTSLAEFIIEQSKSKE